MFSNILVAVDGSDQSDHALATACDIAQKYQAELHLVHSPQLETVALAVGSGAFSVEPSQERVREAGKKVMDQAVSLADKQGCSPKSTIVGNANAAQEILDSAKKIDADLIVMGRRGLGGIASLLLGSVSGKVSQESPCACLTVK
ncbi:MAG: universal stress protein [Stappiaceae bacterium]